MIQKGRGPYSGRYDLPGGRLEAGESLVDGLIREFIEETGYTVKVQQNLGTFDFFIRYNEDNFTHMHHLTALYQVELTGKEGPVAISMFEEQDSLGAEWVDITRVTLESASPLAVYAAKFLKGEDLPLAPEYYDDWEVKGT